MKLIEELAVQLKEAAAKGDVTLCMGLAVRISKVMDTYKRSC